MNRNDIKRAGAVFQFTDIRVAFALLTRLPLPYPQLDANRPAAVAAWAYPLVGLAVGFITILTIAGAMAVGLPTPVAALFGLLAGTLTTGAIHEDGLADCADGFWGGWTRARRLEIMKDSQIGTYGVLALVVSFCLRWQAIVLLINADAQMALIPAATVSRSAMVWMMHRLPNARSSGLSQQTGKPEFNTMVMALSIGIMAVFFTADVPRLMPVAIAALCTFGLSKLAMVKIGGQTGDVLGGTQQVVEIALLLTILSSVGNA